MLLTFLLPIATWTLLMLWLAYAAGTVVASADHVTA
jgi:hypothetical protein